MQQLFTRLLFIVWLPFFSHAQNPPAPARDPIIDSIEACDERLDFARSNLFARQWVAKKKDEPGKDSLDFSRALVLLSDGLIVQGPSAEALSLLEKALEIQIRNHGSVHKEVGRTTSKIGNLYFAREDLKNAEIWWKKAVDIREKALGPNHEDVATSVYNLGLLYEITNVPQSIIFHKRALEIRKKVFGMEHEDVGNSLQALGNVYANSIGDFGNAEPLFQQALAIQIKTLGPDHAYVGYTLNSLGNLYQSLGDYPKAEQYTLRSYELLCKAAGPESADAGMLLINLGSLYQESGDYLKAKMYQTKALIIASKDGEESTQKATSLLNLGMVNIHLGNLAKAEKQLKEAYLIKSRVLGPGHPSAAFIKSQLMLNYTHQRSFAKAEKEGTECLAILEKTWGETFPETMDCRNSLGVLKWTEGKPEKARQWFGKNNTLNQKALEKIFPHLSERGRESFLEKASKNGAYFQSFCTAQARKNPQMAGALYNHRLAYKGLLLNTSARWKQKAKNSGDTVLIQKYGQWEELRNEIGDLFTSNDSAQRAGMDSLLEKAESLEKQLSKALAKAGTGTEWKLRTWQEVQKSLKPGEAAIEMVRLRKFGIAKRVKDTSGVDGRVYEIKDLTDSVQYAALLLRKDSPYPELILLENGNEMEGHSMKRYQNSIHYKIPDAKAYRSYWEPLGKRLKGIRRIWFSGDGIYHQINLNTLQNPATGKYLLDELDLQLVTSSKQLLYRQSAVNIGKTACLIGNPEFSSSNAQALIAGATRSAGQSYYLKPNPDAHLETLPGTQEEIDSIAYILSGKDWGVQKLVGVEASEENVKDQNQPRILLLSTHGYFKPDNSPGHNPLINSGLLLAGAEKTLRDGRPADREDGILTAYEAMNLNLDGTELAVLSACETGLGEIKNGEGVYGLQRAFQVAGARCLIMSLWKVDDKVTRELMVSFFREWTGGSSKREAFIAAQKATKAKYPTPYYWGAFVLVGE